MISRVLNRIWIGLISLLFITLTMVQSVNLTLNRHTHILSSGLTTITHSHPLFASLNCSQDSSSDTNSEDGRTRQNNHTHNSCELCALSALDVLYLSNNTIAITEILSYSVISRTITNSSEVTEEHRSICLGRAPPYSIVA